METPNTPEQITTLRRLRTRMPQLHPVAALNLTIDLMVQREEITSEQYLQWAASLIRASQKPLFTPN